MVTYFGGGFGVGTLKAPNSVNNYFVNQNLLILSLDLETIQVPMNILVEKETHVYIHKEIYVKY